MPIQKIIILGLVLLILVASVLFISHRSRNSLERTLDSFVELVKEGNLNEYNLTIYYFNRRTLTPFMYNIEHLQMGYHERYIIDGDILEENIEVFKQLESINLISVQEKSHIRAWMYYVFKNANGEEIFSVAFEGNDNSMFVCGHEVEENPILYDIIKPFLPDYLLQEIGW